MAFKDRLKELRTLKGYSQSEFADLIGLSKSAISMYEQGNRTPDLPILESIADFFNVDINYLIGKENNSSYYLSPEVAELAQELAERPEMKLLFDASRKATKEDIQMAADILTKLSSK